MKRGLDISTFTNGLLMYYVITRITRPNWILQDSYYYKYSKKVLFILPNKQKTQRSTWGKHLFHWFWQVKVEQIHKLLWQMSQFVLQVYLHIENVIPSVLEMYYVYYIKKIYNILACSVFCRRSSTVYGLLLT